MSNSLKTRPAYGELTPCTLGNYVRAKFATPILYVINNFKNYNIFTIDINPLIIHILCFSKKFSHHHFCSNCFSSILRHSS